MRPRLLTLGLMASLMLAPTLACSPGEDKDDGKMEKIGASLDNAAEDVKDAANDIEEDVKEATKDIKEDVKDATEDIKEKSQGED